MNWGFLERFPGLIAVPAIWRKHLGDDFEAFNTLCLQQCQFLALSFPCPLPTSCSYHIVPNLGGPPSPGAADEVSVKNQSFSGQGEGELSTKQTISFHGLCKRDPPRCPPIQLTLADITPLELNWTKLARAVSKAFGLNSKFAAFQIAHTVQVGTWSADAAPVILTIQTEPHHFRQVVAELIARLRQKFILFTPTSQFFDAVSQELLASANAAAFPLDTNVTLTPNGGLLATKTPGDLFAKFIPEEKLPEDAGLRAFAILKALDTEEDIREAPVFRVFHLYCMENLSVAETAKRLECSRGTITNRLRVIRQKTGTDAQNLRAYSAQFVRIEQSLSDSRAKRAGTRTETDRSPHGEQE